MKLKSNLQLRCIGSQYMIVEAGPDCVNLASVYRLSSTAAALWQQMEQGMTNPRDLVTWLCDHYEVDRQTALHDVMRQLKDWKDFGLIVDDETDEAR